MINKISKLILMSLMAFSLVACLHDEDKGPAATDPAVDVHGDGPSTATPIVSGVTLAGNINLSGDDDVFALVSTGGTISVVTSGNTDTFCEVFSLDQLGNEVLHDADDDSGSVVNCSLETLVLPAGVYFVRISGFFLSTTGAYNVTVRY